MPELPDVQIYVDAFEGHVVGQTLQRVRLISPFVLRTAVPPIASAEGRRVVGIRRIGKRLVLALEGELFLVFHLMIAGRLRWLSPGEKPPGRITLAVLEFREGILALTEAGTKRRASLHLVAGEAALAAFDAGGLEVLKADLAAFSRRLKSENHTLKRALGRDPAPRKALAGRDDLRALRRAGGTAVRGDTRNACRLDRAVAARDR